MIPAGGTVDDLVVDRKGKNRPMQKFILSVTVQNNAGVLARVSSLFGRRGYNIDSLTVSATNDPRVSRMSIIVQGDEVILEQIIKQLDKLGRSCASTTSRSMTRYAASLSFVKLHAQSPSTRTTSVSCAACTRGPHR